MRIRTARIWPSPQAVLGALYIDNASQGVFTLEPGLAQDKGPIPAGTYQVVLLPSPHFEASEDPWVKQYASKMPHLVDVPNFTHMMLHWGDLPENTEGCVLVGNARISATEIGDSRRAFATLYKKIAMAFGRNESISFETQDVKVPMPQMVVSDPEIGL